MNGKQRRQDRRKWKYNVVYDIYDDQGPQSREEYDIKIYKESPKGTFWCNCADHKFNSSKKGTACKHICFLVCKVIKILDPEFFEDKNLSTEQIDMLLKKLTSETTWTDTGISKKLAKITLQAFRNYIKQVDDCCPICFNDCSICFCFLRNFSSFEIHKLDITSSCL